MGGEYVNERIAKIRKDANLTQEEFGEKIGKLSKNYIWMLEKGDRKPSDRTIAEYNEKVWHLPKLSL